MKITEKRESNKLKYFLFLCISGYFSLYQGIPAYSQDSLSNYLEIAAKNNPVVMQKYYEYQAALKKIPQVGSLADPELTVGVFLSPMELVSGNQVADIRLMQMFPWFGVLQNAKDEMSLMAKAKFESFRDAKLQVFYEVQRNWYDLNKIQSEIRISEKNKLLLQSLERLMLVKFKSGALTGSNVPSQGTNNSTSSSTNTSSGSSAMGSMNANGNVNPGSVQNQLSTSMQGNSMTSSGGGSALTDLYRLQIELGELENNIESLKSLQNSIGARFNASLNRPAKQPVSLPDTLNQLRPDMSLLTLSDTLFVNNPMLGMLQYENQSIDARKKMITRMGYPMIGLGVNYTIINKSEMSTSSMNGKDMIMPMLTVTLPIYRKKYRAMQDETDIIKEVNEQNYKATRNSLQTEYFEALQAFQDAQRRMKLFEKQSLLVQQTLKILIISFSSSGSSLTDILRLQQQLIDYEYKQVEAIVDYNNSISLIIRLTAYTEIR
jgi:outer membrane protein TolC